MGMNTILVRSPDTALAELFALIGDQDQGGRHPPTL
jgi:hypothetical protein